MANLNLERDIDITKFLPSVTDQSRDIVAALQAENVELTALWNAYISIFENQFIDYAGEYGLSQWESMLDIIPKSTDAVEDRRFRILTYLKGNRPYTDEKLEELLDQLCGANGYLIERDYDKYSFTFKLNLGVKSQLDSAADMLERIIPKNLLLTVTLNYNRHKDLKQKFTHGGMKPYTHKSLREDVL